MAVFANRLLKFKFPVFRNLQAYERLLSRQLQAPKPSKKMLETLPVPVLEALHQQVWQLALPDSSIQSDLLLSLTLLVEEMSEYHLQEWVHQDIQLLGSQGNGQLHGYYFSPQADPQTYPTLLKQYGYRTDFLTPQTPLLQSYLICRALTYPLPWSALLESRDLPNLEAFPRLRRLQKIHLFFQENGYYTKSALSPDSLSTLLEEFRTLEVGPFLGFSKNVQVACPVRELVLVEGATEELLLPAFSHSMGVDLYQEGIHLQAAGGKNQVPALYLKMAEVLQIPIFMVLDRDAEAICHELQPALRPQDRLFLLPEGEFEDTYDLDLILKTINEHYHPHPRITRQAFVPPEDATTPIGRVETLRALWKTFQLGDFDKTHFAERVCESLAPSFQPSVSIRTLINAILENRYAALDSDA